MRLYTQMNFPYIILICLFLDASHVSFTQCQARRSFFPITAILQGQGRQPFQVYIIANF